MKRITARRQDRFLFKRRLISVAVMSAVSGHLNANPTGPQVVNGQVSVTAQGSVLTVTNTPNAIVNWQSFSIGGNETTRFVQQSAASAVLNRVVGVDPSVILGTLQSNGKVLLINTNGIMFGQGARVDVAGLVASTLNLNDQDFLAGRLNFQSSPLGNGSVVNRGTIATPEGGSVFLVGTAVENSGIIHAPGGEVILAAGQSVRLGSTGAPNVLVEVEAPANRAVNLGEIAVGAGKAGIYGGFVEQKGIVSANTATVNAAGKIVFKATRDTTVAAGSTTTASGAHGGTVAVESGGTTRVEGVVSATGASGKGGTIHLLGKQVGVAGGAAVYASGAAGGGTILVGGDYKGGNRDVVNARATFVGADTQLRADATDKGDGGRIIVWSDEVTRAHGDISARGGPLGGDGGFVETSSAGYLEVTRGPDLTAPIGAGGTWLLDPFNIIVSNVSSQLLRNSGAPNFTPTGDTSTIGADLIGAQLSTGVNVTLDTSGAGAEAGSIVVQGSILKTAGGRAELTLKAHNNIYLQPGSRIESSAGALVVTLNADQDASGAGGVSLNGASIVTNGGNLVVGGGADPLIGFAIAAADATFGDLASGVALFNSSISTGAGNVSMRGRTNVAPGQFGDAVNLNDNAVIQTTSGSVNIYGDASARSGNVSFAAGVRLDFTARISSQTGTVLLNGVGAGTPALPATSGTSGVVVQKDALLEVTGAGRIELVGNGGTSSSTTDSVEGVTLLDRARLLADGGGSIAITGSPGTPAPGGHIQNGVALNSAGSTPGVTVRAGGAGGSITITGLAANGTVVENANGVVLQQAGTLVEATGDATITINGTGSDTSIAGGWAGTNGLLMFGGARIRSAAGAITITGTGGLTTSTGSGAQGITMFDAGTAITTVDGAIQITGTGGGTLANPSGQSAHGIALQSGAKIEATGSGTVTLTGTSGVVAGVFNPNFGRFTTAGAIAAYSDGVDVGGGAQVITNSGALTIVGTGAAVLNDALGTQGVLVANSGSSVQSSSGNISITGTGGGTAAGRSGGDTLGVLVWDNASVSTGGAGTVRIEGTGGATSGGISIGVSVYAGSSVTANDGDITLIGVGGQSTNTYLGRDAFANHGVEVGSDTGSGRSSSIRTTGNGSILLQGMAGNAAGGANDAITLRENTVVATAGTGSVTLLGTLSSAAVDDTASTFAGDGWNGGVLITAGSSVRSGVNLTSGGGAITITGLGPVDGTGAASTPQLVAVRIDSGALVESVAGGAISISGDLRDARTAGLQGVDITGSSQVLGHAGSVSISGIGGSANRSDADGVVISNGGLVETSFGNITLTGSLIDFANPDGRYLQGVTVVGATVRTTATGSITLEGTGPGTLTNRVKGNSGGIAIVNGATVAAEGGGDITLVGSGGFATDGFISGVYISSDFVFVNNSPGAPGAPVSVTAVGTGKVTITGFLGSPGTQNGTNSAGVSIQGFTPIPGSGAGRPIGATVTTEDGALTITGYGSGFVRSATPSIDETLAGAGNVQGIYLANDARIGSKGSGAVRIEGSGGVVRGYLKDSFANPGTQVLGVDAMGVTIEKSATVFSTSAALNIVATGGYSNNANVPAFAFPAGTVATEGAGALIAGGNAEFPTVISSVSGDVRIRVTAPGTLTQPIGSEAGAAFGFGNIIVSTGASHTIEVLGDFGATTNGHSSAVWFRDAVVNFDAGTVNLLGNTENVAVSTNSGSNPVRAAGVEIHNSTLTTSGVLNVTGVGGDAAHGQNYGVWIHDNSSVSATNAGASIAITGTGGGTGSANDASDGINIDGASAVTAAGNLTLNGTGAGTAQARAGGRIAGVRIAEGSTVTGAGASSSVMITGDGGFQTGSGSQGVSVEGAGSAIRAPNGGSITIVGNAGDSDLTTANTAGALVGANPDLATWDPTGLEWSGFGVQIINGASIASNTGDISVTGTGGLAGAGATAGKGFWGAGIEMRGGIAVSTVSGAIHLTGTAPGDVTRPMGRNTWGVHLEEAAAITSTGAAGGSITITGIGTFASGMFDSAGALGAPAVVADASGVELHAGGVVSTVGGDITLDGTTARVPANTFGRIGVAIGEATDAGAFSGVASQSGKITITGDVPTAQAGFAGAAGLSDGVLLYQGGYVQTASGAIAITGHAGEGTGGGMVGVELFDDATVPEAQHSQVLSTDGTVSIVGTGGASSGTGARNVGVAIGQGSFVATIGTGSVDIRGTGGAGTDGENHGVWVHDGSTVVTVGNDAGIAISGMGGTGSASDGIHIDGASTEVAGAAITLIGTSGAGGSSLGIHQLVGAITAEALTVSADGGVSMTGANVLDALTATNATSGNLDIHVQTRKLAPIGDVILNDIVNSGPGDVNLTIGQPASVAYGMQSGHVYSSGGAFNVDHAEMLGVTINSASASFTGVSISGGDNVFNTGGTSIENLTLDSASTPLQAVTLRGASTLAITGQFAWYDGVVANDGGLTTGGSTSILRTLPDANITPRTATLDTNWTTLAGSIAQYDGNSSGNFVIRPDRSITNAGQFLIDPVPNGPSAGSIQGTGATFVNRGRLAKTTDVDTQLDTRVVNDGGTIVSDVGTLQITDLTLQGAGAVQGAAPISVSGSFTWTGGTIAAGTSVSANGTGSIAPGGAKTLDGTLVNNATSAFAVQDNVAGIGLLHNRTQMDVLGSFTVQPGVANDKQLNILPGTGVHFGGALSNSQSGAINIASNDTTIASLIVTGDVTNDGAINLTAGGTGATNAGFGVTTGTLTNSLTGNIHSLGNSGVFFNRLSGNIVNQGTIDVTDSLRMDNAGFTFTNAGSVSIGPSQLFINGGDAGATVNLSNGIAIPFGASSRLAHVAVNGPAGISNSGTLGIEANTDIGGALANNVGGVIEVRSLGNSVATLSNDGTISLIADSGLASLDVGQGFTNAGTIEVVAAGATDGAALRVASGTLLNTGTLRSRALAGAGNNGFDAQISNTGTIDIAYSARLANEGKTFDTSNGTVNVAAGQTFTVDQGPFVSPTPGTTVFGTGTSLGTGTGTLSLLQGKLDVAGNATIRAAGAALEVRSTNISGAGTLTNLGTIRAFSTNNNLRVPLTNQGTVTVQPGGTLVTFQPVTNAVSGRFNVWASDGTGAAAPTSLWVTQTMDNAGTIELRSDASLGYTASLILSAGAVVNNANTIHTLLGGVGSSTPNSFINPAGANGRINNTGTLLIDNNTLVALTAFDTSSGTVDVASGKVLSLTGAITTSTGTTLRVQPGSQLTVGDGFVNNGLIDLQRSGAANAVMIVASSALLSNAGTIQSSGAGTARNELRLKNGNTTPSPALVFENRAGGVIRADASLFVNHFDGVADLSHGTLDVAAGQVLDFHNYATATGANVMMGAGTLFGTGTGTISVSDGSWTLTGNQVLPASGPRFEFHGAATAIDGPGFSLTNNGTLSLSGAGVNVPLINNGTVVVTGPASPTFINFVTFADQLSANAGSTLQIDGGGWLTVGGFNNLGTIVLNSAVAGTSFDGANLSVSGALSNNGTIVSHSAGGTQVNRIQGNVTSAGSATGAIVLDHDLVITGSLTIPSTAAGLVASGAGNLKVDGGLSASATGAAVTLGGTGKLTTSGASTESGGQLHLDGRRWENLGALTINGRLTLDNGAVLTNEANARLTLAGSNGSPIAQGGGAPGAVSNAGMLTKTSTAAQTIGLAFDNSGTVNVNAGTLNLAASGTHTGTFAVNGAELVFTGGTHTFGAAPFSGSGRVRVNGTSVSVSFDTATDVANPFTLEDGTVRGAGDLTLNGQFTLGGGAISGSGRLVTYGATTVNNATGLLDGRAWNNAGAMTVNGRINLANGGSVTNEATGSVDLSATNTNPTPIRAGAGGGSFLNQGIVTKSNPIAQNIDVVFANSGTVRVNSGTLTATSFPSNSGTIDIGAGAMFATNRQALVNSATGTIAGSGTLSVGGATLTNSGTLSPGASPGTLHIVGDLALTPSSMLAMEIDGTGPGEFDVIDVSGSATLAGALRVTLPGSYAGGVGDTFQAVTAKAISGSFATINVPTDMTLTPAYAASGVTLSIDALINRWRGTSGVWTQGSNWGLGRAPRSREDVFVDIGIAQTIEVPDGTPLDAGSITVSGGMLDLQGAARIASGTQVRVSGGTLNSAGSLDNAGTVHLAAGTMQVAKVTNTGTLDLEGGTLKRSPGSTFGNSGTVSVTNQTLILDGGDGGVGGGSYTVGSGGTLHFSAGTYSVGSLMTNGGGLMIDGATVTTTGALTNTSVATLQSGTLNVGGVANSGTFNLDGAALIRAPGASFGNSGTVNLNKGTLSLDGGDGGMSGGSYNLKPATALEFTSGSYGIGSIAGGGAVTVSGKSTDTKLYSSKSMTISAQTLTVEAGERSASIDPPDINLDVPGGLSLIGGSANGAYAQILGGNVSIKTSKLTLTGGTGDGSFAAIQAVTGNATIESNEIVMTPGSGSSSSAWMSAAGPLRVTAVSCNGCTLLTVDPSQSPSPQAGLFGNPVALLLPADLVQVPPSVIVGVQTAQGGGQADTTLGSEQQEGQAAQEEQGTQKEAEQEKEKDEAKDKEQAEGETRAREEHKSERPRQVCM